MDTTPAVRDRAVQVINDTHNRILRYNYKGDFAPNLQKTSAGLLYYFTTADGLKGIIENGEIWSTSA